MMPSVIEQKGVGLSVSFTMNGRPRGILRVTSARANGDTVPLVLDEIVPTAQRERDAVVSRLPLDLQPEASLLLCQIGDAVLSQRSVAGTPSSSGADDLQGEAVTYEDIVPADDPVEGTVLLDALVADAQRFLVVQPVAYDVLALWALHSHLVAQGVFDISPVLGITSPGPGCGKTQVLRWLKAIVPKPDMAANATTAYLFRVIEMYQPTMLIDEADCFLGESEKLRSLINSGYARDGSFRLTIGDDHEPRAFKTFAAKAIAGVGELHRTIAERSIPIEMQKKTREEPITRMRARRYFDEHEPLRRQAARWAADHGDALREADTLLPDELDDRQWDLWEPLFAIADLAGGSWPVRARRVAAVLCRISNEGTEGVSEQLLADLRECLNQSSQDHVTTDGALTYLRGLPERPWPTWHKGREIDARALGRLLKPFKVKAKTLHGCGPNGKDIKGYLASDLAEPFKRYLRASLSVPPSQTMQDNELRDFLSVRPGGDRTDEKSSKVLPYNVSDGGTDKASAYVEERL